MKTGNNTVLKAVLGLAVLFLLINADKENVGSGLNISFLNKYHFC